MSVYIKADKSGVYRLEMITGHPLTNVLILGRPVPYLHTRTPAEYRSYMAATRVYVSVGDDEVGMETPPYGSTRGDGSAEDVLWIAYNKGEMNAMRARIATVRPALELFTGLRAEDKLRFSRKAGCSACPCSPGFITRDHANHPLVLHYGPDGAQRPVDIWLRPVKKETA